MNSKIKNFLSCTGFILLGCLTSFFSAPLMEIINFIIIYSNPLNTFLYLLVATLLFLMLIIFLIWLLNFYKIRKLNIAVFIIFLVLGAMLQLSVFIDV